MMAQIRVLPAMVVNKIAAGEVIERPASVVKELMENAIDAGARRIDVTVEHGGQDLIRVSDDGCGIAADQLPLAVASHATSKIQDAEDLFRVTTLGFRGEALASIAAVSRLRIVSRPADAASGAQLDVAAGELGQVVPCGCPQGTTVEVRHLFFNTPVRRKFLRTTQTELGHIIEAFLRVALPYPSIHCTLRHADRLVHDLPAVERWHDRLVHAFGEELVENLLWIECRDEEIQLSGYISDPNVNRANNRWQYFFLNGRFIRDRSLQHALQEAYRGLLMQGRYPVAFLRWNMPPDCVDVNVHPTKLEVRFQDGARIYSQLLGTIRGRFLGTDLTVRVGRELPGDSSPDVFTGQQTDGLGGVAASGPMVARGSAIGGRSVGSTASDIAGNWRPGATVPDPHVGQLTLGEQFSPGKEPASNVPPASYGPFLGYRQQTAGATHAETTRSEVAAPHSAAPSAISGSAARSSPHGIQIHNRYLVAETDEGLLVIDQHALHERILYEKLRQRVSESQLEVQPLLVPEPVTLGASEAAIALENRSTLAAVGIHIEPFGGDAVLITAYPSMLANFNPSEVLQQAVEQIRLGQGNLSREQVLDELLHMMACKAAVKAGDRLAPEEVAALLEYRDLCRDAHHCPHGRPTALIFTRDELDRRFRRI